MSAIVLSSEVCTWKRTQHACHMTLGFLLYLPLYEQAPDASSNRNLWNALAMRQEKDNCLRENTTFACSTKSFRT